MNHECLFKQIYTAQCTDWLCSMTTSSIINLWPEFKPEKCISWNSEKQRNLEKLLGTSVC